MRSCQPPVRAVARDLRPAAPHAARSRSSLARQTLGAEAFDGARQLGDLPARLLDAAQRGADMLYRGHDPVNAFRRGELEHWCEGFRGAVDLTSEDPRDGQGAARAGFIAEGPVLISGAPA